MNHLATLFVLILVQLTPVSTASNATVFTLSTVLSTTSPIRKRCVQAHVNASEFWINQYCKPYEYSENGFCKDIIKDRDVYGVNQKEMEQSLQRVLIGKRMLEGYIPVSVRDSCIKVFNQTYCQYSFPMCDITSSLPKARPVCRESCEDVYERCDKEIELLIGFNTDRIKDKNTGNAYPYYWNIINCSVLEYRNGGDLPECYFSRHLNTETDKLKSSACYYGNGLGYRGNVSVTRSGHVCQSWSSQCPHRHDHPLSEYPELVNVSNWCRNPGGQGPHGPWCYTTNSSIRWEYCDVEKCAPPAPTLAPEITEAYSIGPNKVIIKWNPVPLPFMHGEPRGFRINVFLFGQVLRSNRTGPNTTTFEYRNLKALTNYSISVLAFNDAGDGPRSKRVYVETMPKIGPSISPLENKTVTKGDPILLLCNATGDPAPIVSWSKANGTINPSYVSGKELWILSAKLSDAGKYTCTAKNDVSMTTVEAFVTVKLRPHSPVPLSTQLTHLTVKVYWKKPKSHGYPVLMYSVHRVELDQAGQEVTSRTYHVNEDVHDYEARNIEGGKTYKFYVTAWNTHGESVKDHRKSVTVKVQKP